jgi:23S rRNA (guanine745-N1)-methyltransferase
VSDVPLACTVADCGQPLTRAGRTWTCPKGHAFDIARRGYVNLLQPQDRRSRHPGDTTEAVAARARLGVAGVGRHLIESLVERIAAFDLLAEAVAVDLGCGTGEMLVALTGAQPVRGIGIDISAAAIDHAAGHGPAVTWVVANADRRLPLLDQGVDLVLSVHGRRNPAECTRVLRPEGLLLVAVPAPDDLIELRTLVQGVAVERSRVDDVLAEHADDFVLHDRFAARERRRLDRPALLDLLRSTYRGARASATEAVSTLTTLHVTLASDVVVLTLPPRASIR